MVENSTEWQFTEYNKQHLVTTSICLGFFTFCCIISNSLVIAAVLVERSLQNLANYLIVSLAVTDLLLSVIVLPLSAIKVISKYWFLPRAICRIWLSVDVICCVSSIYHLLAIALDRYWAVTSITYIHARSMRRIIIMVSISWGMGLLIAVPHFLGLLDVEDNLERRGKCSISTKTGLTIFAALGAFYLPMVAILIIYLKIYLVAKSMVRSRKTIPKLETASNASSSDPSSSTMPSGSSEGIGKCCGNLSTKTAGPDNGGHIVRDEKTQSMIDKNSRDQDKLQQKRERKAARTLSVITGTFLICWFPFFTMLILDVFMGVMRHSPPGLVPFFIWLGYLNSMINPVIYTTFSPEFRAAFKKILYRNCKICEKATSLEFTQELPTTCQETTEAHTIKSSELGVTQEEEGRDRIRSCNDDQLATHISVQSRSSGKSVKSQNQSKANSCISLE